MKQLEYFDTHSHIHFADYKYDADATWEDAKAAGVTRMIAVGCRLEDSQGAIEFAGKHKGVWASIGIHPHEAGSFLKNPDLKKEFKSLIGLKKLVAIGEIGLDYYYKHSSKENQIELLEWQLSLAQKHKIPVIFHIRDAFDDFWPIFDKYELPTSLIHSFTGTVADVEQILKRDLMVALNGIMTFTKQAEQLEAAKMIPLNKLVLETDAPYLTPKPLRGKICKPEFVRFTGEFLAELRGESVSDLADQTTLNAKKIFKVS